MVRLVPYADADLPLTEALESDPDVMRELGGPMPRTRILANHRRRLGDPWWLTIVPEPGGPPAGTIGIWEAAGRRRRCHHWALETPDVSSATRSSTS